MEENQCPGNQLGKIVIKEKIKTIHSIDWGENHMLMIDQKFRVFALGSNRHGKTGLGLTVVNHNWHNEMLDMDPQSYQYQIFKDLKQKEQILFNKNMRE